MASCKLTRTRPRLRPKKHNITLDYDISSTVLGTGENGRVLSCTLKATKKTYALKILGDALASRREVELHWQACGNNYIVDIKDVYENIIDGRLYVLLVLEHMGGGELFDRIKTQSFTEQQAATIAQQIVAAVSHLHRMNVAHRDLKPENLLFKDHSLDSPLKLADFGFAKEVPPGTMLQDQCYTLYYAAPEVLRGDEYDISCDMWSLGVILYILLCGYPPFNDGSGLKQRIVAGQYTYPSAEWSHISLEAKGLISQLLNTDPNDRMSVEGVLKHPWMTGNGIYHPLPC